MTEAGWLACSDPDWLLEPTNHIFHKRKTGLWAAACCRRAWHLLPNIHREVLVAAEVSCERLDHLVGVVDDEIRKVAFPYWPYPTFTSEREAVGLLSGGSHRSAVEQVATALTCEEIGCTPNPTQKELQARYWAAWKRHQGIHADLLRDVIGNPYRPAKCHPDWLTSDVLALARGIYEERAFDRMPILADALQDAGCDNDDILNHCRDHGTHVRGCWGIDLILDKP